MNKKSKLANKKHRRNKARIKGLNQTSLAKAKPAAKKIARNVEIVIEGTKTAKEKTAVKKVATKKAATKKTAVKKAATKKTAKKKTAVKKAAAKKVKE